MGATKGKSRGPFVAFVIKIPNAFTDFNLWAGKRKATPSPPGSTYKLMLLNETTSSTTRHSFRDPAARAKSCFCEPIAITIHKDL